VACQLTEHILTYYHIEEILATSAILKISVMKSEVMIGVEDSRLLVGASRVNTPNPCAEKKGKGKERAGGGAKKEEMKSNIIDPLSHVPRRANIGLVLCILRATKYDTDPNSQDRSDRKR